ncbi:hypothetical protein VTP01DRAFT_4930 [Rhizomucor pusillus]|uniref:uncharacterized protein n=1 Tax=Rhizomucor pusillus TaxID=4840 RepID=UPI003742CF38
MDPYQRPPYGYRPPAPYGGPPSGPGFRPPRPPMYGGGHMPGGYMPHGRPQMPQQIGAPPMGMNRPPQGTESNKLTTLFVGAIAPGVSDAWIEKLLKACGSLVNWKRVKDPSGKPKGFGFAEYEDPESVLRALKVLGGEENTHEGLVLTAADGSQTQKKLIVKADDNVRNHLDEYQATKQRTEADDEKDQQALTFVREYVELINSGKEPEAETETNEISEETTNETENADGDTKMAEPRELDDETLDRELAFFKERAAQRVLEKQREEAEQQHKKPREHESPESEYRESGRRGRRDRYGSRQEFVRGPTEHSNDVEDEDELSDEELERRREKRRQEDIKAIFEQKEKRWESKEAARLRDYHRSIMREREEEERRERERQYWEKRLAEWDDEYEMERGEELYYVNRAKWRKHREVVRRREYERDEEDRRLEAQEIEEERRHREEMERSQRRDENEQRPQEGKIALKPTKLNINMPIKRISAMGGNDEDEDEESGGKKRRVLVPLDYGDDVMLDESSHMDPEERVRLVKELIESIPSSEQELWQWSVKWDQLDDELVNTKLKPFVAKKVVELVGEEEEEFINFILDNVRRQQTPESLVKELEMTLDQEALVFVMKLWRALIFETERKWRKL